MKCLDGKRGTYCNSALAVRHSLYRRPTRRTRFFAAVLSWFCFLLWGVAAAFGQSSEAQLIQTLRTGPQAEARRLAALRLGKVDAAHSLEPLMAALLADKNATVRASCAESLGVLGSPAALSALGAAARDENETVRGKVEVALARIKERMATKAERLIVLVSGPSGKYTGKNAAAMAGLAQRLRGEFARELRANPGIDVREDFHATGDESAFSVEGSVSNMSRRTTPRGELEISFDINVVITLLPARRVVGIVSGGASTFSPRDSAARLNKTQVATLEEQALTQSVQAATENLLSFLRAQRKTTP